MKRVDDRRSDQMRPFRVTYDVYQFAPGSVLFQVGNTKVLCAVSIENSVPPFLRGKSSGWLTAEYALLPASTMQRTPREAATMKRAGRSVEISRLVSRTLRMAVDMQALGERTVYIDCDVLQADGGTRTASINGAYLALRQAEQRWLQRGIIDRPFIVRELAALSVGIANNSVILDPDYQEDSVGDADINVIMTRDNKVIEIQGGAEKNPFTWDQFEVLKTYTQKGCDELFALYDAHRPPLDDSIEQGAVKNNKKNPLFSLINRKIAS
jgi:ribonuclease PH